MPRQRKEPWRDRWRRRVRRMLALAVLAAAAYLAFAIITWPRVGALKTERPASTAFIERYLEKSGAKRVAQTWVPYDRISLAFKHAVLAGEDIGFIGHDGFATEEIEDAVKDAVLEGKKLRGASTITQQLAKNLWLSPSRNPLRKVKEAIFTYQLEKELSKKRILEIYVNVVELGPGVFGVEAAAQRWFGVSAASLDEEQAIALAAMLPAPKKWRPDSESQAYQRHRDAIRRRMGSSQYLRQSL